MLELPYVVFLLFFFNDTATTEIYTLSLHDALPIWILAVQRRRRFHPRHPIRRSEQSHRSEEHTSELQSHLNLVCRLLLEKKKPRKHCTTLRSTPSPNPYITFTPPTALTPPHL